MSISEYWPFLLIAYVLGSIPVGYLIGKLQGTDIRKLGSGNIGFTNVKRLLGSYWASLVLVLDASAGLLPLLWADYCDVGPQGLAACGFLTVFGHIFPVWFGDFKGGKGVATATGVVFFFTGWGLTLALMVFLFVFVAKQYFSLSSLVATAFILLYRLGQVLVEQEAFFDPVSYSLTLMFAGVVALIFYSHRENIKRLRLGTERKSGQS